MKGRSFSPYRLYFDLTIKLFNNLLWNIQTQTDSVNIHLIWVINVSKQFEQFILIFNFNADSCICYWYFKVTIFILFCNFSFDCNFPLICELDCIRLQIQKHLLNTWFIVGYYCVLQRTQITCQLYIFNGGYHSLNAHDFFYAFLKIKLLYICSKLVLIDLRIVKKILYKKLNYL